MGIEPVVDFFYKLFHFIRNLLFPGRKFTGLSAWQQKLEQRPFCRSLLKIVRLFYFADYSEAAVETAGLPWAFRIFFFSSAVLLVFLLFLPPLGAKPGLLLFSFAFALAVSSLLLGCLHVHPLLYAAAAFLAIFSLFLFNTFVLGRIGTTTLLSLTLAAAFFLSPARRNARGISGIAAFLVISLIGAGSISLVMPHGLRRWVFWGLMPAFLALCFIKRRGAPPPKDRFYTFLLIFPAALMLMALFSLKTETGQALESIVGYSRWLIPNLWPLWYWIGGRLVFSAISNGRVFAEATGEMFPRIFPRITFFGLAVLSAAFPFFEKIAASLNLSDAAYFTLRIYMWLALFSFLFLFFMLIFREGWKKHAPSLFWINVTAYFFIHEYHVQFLSLNRYFQKHDRLLQIFFTLIAVFIAYATGTALIKKSGRARPAPVLLLMGILLLIASLCYINALPGQYNVVPAIFYFNFLAVVHLSVPFLLLVIVQRHFLEDGEKRRRTIRLFVFSFVFFGPLVPALKKVIFFGGDVHRLFLRLRQLAASYQAFPAIRDWRIDAAVLFLWMVLAIILSRFWRKKQDIFEILISLLAAALGIVTYNLYQYSVPFVPEAILKLLNPSEVFLFFSPGLFLAYLAWLLPPIILYLFLRGGTSLMRHAGYFLAAAAAEVLLIVPVAHDSEGLGLVPAFTAIALSALGYLMYREASARQGRPVQKSVKVLAGSLFLFFVFKVAFRLIKIW